MKKIIVAAAIIFTSGFLSLYINNKSSQSSSATIKVTFYDYKKELGSGD
jgi:hypothetical protein